MSKQALRMLALMLDDTEVEWFGLQMSRATGIAPGTLYPNLHRLLSAGWLEARTEQIDPSVEKRPARRMYRLTGKGELAARARLEPNTPARARRLIPEAGTG